VHVCQIFGDVTFKACILIVGHLKWPTPLSEEGVAVMVVNSISRTSDFWSCESLTFVNLTVAFKECFVWIERCYRSRRASSDRAVLGSC